MSITAGQFAVIRRLADNAGGYNVVWPDHDGSNDYSLPRFVAELAGGATNTLDLSGNTEADVQVSVKVETDEGGFAAVNLAMQAILTSLFRPGTTFSGVQIDDPITTRPPLENGGVFTVPVIIRGRYIY
jgi:hypothetical protein